MKRYLFVLLLFLSVVEAKSNCATGIIEAPIIESISVLPNGDVVISWLDVLDADLTQYNIWTIDGTGANIQLGTVPVGTTTFTLAGSNANNTASAGCMQIMVQSEMNCPPPVGAIFNPDFSAAGAFNCTSFLEGTFVPCAASVDLSWNTNSVFFNPRYQVFVSVDGAIAVPASSTMFSTTYTYNGIVFGSTYDFYIVTTDNGGLGPATATSNLSTPSIDGFLFMPTFNYLNNATVVNLERIDLVFSIDTNAAVTSYKVKRATSVLGPFTTVGSVDKFQGMDTLVNFSDVDVKTDSISYTYKIEIVNTNCGFDSNYSNSASTVLIDVLSSSVDAINIITITEYKDWDLGVLKYDIYRALGGVWETSPVHSLPAFSNNMTYVDDVSEVFDGDGEFCYRVEAVSKGLDDIRSSSNESCALHEPLIYMPNAFSPDGLYNKEFKPVLTFANPNTYSFRVYSRWGEVVFQSNDVTRGWNGRPNNSGELSPVGVYFYVVEFNSAEGSDFTKRGTVTIIN